MVKKARYKVPLTICLVVHFTNSSGNKSTGYAVFLEKFHIGHVFGNTFELNNYGSCKNQLHQLFCAYNP
ncbi:hypothetical protein OAS18_06180 [Nitrospinaceae bacterium]|nr:hypothetical protein [Nitrospinaceae bacterium]